MRKLFFVIPLLLLIVLAGLFINGYVKMHKTDATAASTVTTIVPAEGPSEKGPVKIHNQKISGEIKQDQIWSGKIFVTRAISVAEGVTLIIEAGTIVEFKHWRHGYTDPDHIIALHIHGTMKAIGTPGKPIKFTSDAFNPEHGDWLGVIFEATSTDSIMDHCIIEYGSFSASVWRANVTISNSILRWTTGGNIFLTFSSSSITRNRIYQNGHGCIEMEDSNPTITYNTIWGSPTNGIWADSNSHPIIRYNIIRDCLQGGIGIVNLAAATIENNTITGNGFGIGVSQRSQSSRVTIKHNNIYGNKNTNIQTDSTVTGDVDATNNWWGTTDKIEIEFKIHDSRRDPTLGTVFYEPYLASEVDIGTLKYDFENNETYAHLPGTENDTYLYTYGDDDTRKIVGSWHPFDFPTGIVWDGQYFWVVGQVDKTVNKFDSSFGLIDSFTSPATIPYGLTFDGEYLWLIEYAKPVVYQLDLSGKVIKSIPAPGEHNMGLAWDGKYFWAMPFEETYELHKFDTSGNIVGTVQTEVAHAQAMTWDGSHLWIADNGEDMIYEVEPSDGRIIKSITAPADYTFGITWQDIYLWCTDWTNQLPESGRVFKILPLEGGRSIDRETSVSKYLVPSTYYAMDNVHEVAVNPVRKELYATSQHVPLILVVDINSSDYPVLGEIKLPGGDLSIPPYIVFSNDGKYAYVPRYHYPPFTASWGLQNASYIVVINCAERKIDHIIYPPYELGGVVAPSSDGRWLYFNTRDRLGIGKLDLQSGEVVGFLPLDIGSSFIALSNDDKYLYTTQGSSMKVGWRPPGFENRPFHLFTAIDAENLKVISSVEVGDNPRYFAVTPDGSKAYVSNQWDNSVSVINLITMKIIANISVDPEPNEITFTPDGDKAYVGLPGNAPMMAGGLISTNIVDVIDTKRDVLLGSIKVHQDPVSVAMDPDGTKVYVSDGGANGPSDYAEIHIIDTANDTYLRPIYLRKPAQYAPSGIDIMPDNSKLFVITTNLTNFPQEKPRGSLLAIDVATGNAVGKLDIDPRAVKVSADGSKIYVFSRPAPFESEAKLLIIDSNSLKTLKSINLGRIGIFGGGIFIYRILLNSAETIVYLNYGTFDIYWSPENVDMSKWVNPNDTGLVAVDLVNGKVDNIFYSNTPAIIYKGMALTPDETRLFISDPASQTVVVVNTSTHGEIVRIPVGWSPAEVKISRDGKRVYVLQQYASFMTIIDANTYKILKKVDFPCAIAAQMDFEFSSDERYVYVAAFDSNFVLVYDLQEEKVVKVIDTGLDPLDMATTPDRHYIYVSEVTGDEISVVDATTNNIVNTIRFKD